MSVPRSAVSRHRTAREGPGPRRPASLEPRGQTSIRVIRKLTPRRPTSADARTAVPVLRSGSCGSPRLCGLPRRSVRSSWASPWSAGSSVRAVSGRGGSGSSSVVWTGSLLLAVALSAVCRRHRSRRPRSWSRPCSPSSPRRDGALPLTAYAVGRYDYPLAGPGPRRGRRAVVLIQPVGPDRHAESSVAWRRPRSSSCCPARSAPTCAPARDLMRRCASAPSGPRRSGSCWPARRSRRARPHRPRDARRRRPPGVPDGAAGRRASRWPRPDRDRVEQPAGQMQADRPGGAGGAAAGGSASCAPATDDGAPLAPQPGSTTSPRWSRSAARPAWTST